MISEFKFSFNFEKKLCEFRLNDYEEDITFYQNVLFNEDKKILNIEQVGFIAIQTFRPGYEPKYILSTESFRSKVAVYEIKTIDYFRKRIFSEQLDEKSAINIADRFNDIIKQEALIRKDIPSNKIREDYSLMEVLLREYALAHFDKNKHLI